MEEHESKLKGGDANNRCFNPSVNGPRCKTYYHGTSVSSMTNILNNGIDLSQGKGELGVGFYMGDSLQYAFRRAWYKNQGKEIGILIFKNPNFDNLNVQQFSRNEAKMFYESQQTMTGSDVVTSPILDDPTGFATQVKLETPKAKNEIEQAYGIPIASNGSGMGANNRKVCLLSASAPTSIRSAI